MPRVIGIDPGTVSIDLCGLDNGRLFLDRSWPTAEALADPAPFVAELEAAGPLDLVVGPSGYGLPITRVQDITEEALRLAFLAAPGETGGIGGLRTLVRARAPCPSDDARGAGRPRRAGRKHREDGRGARRRRPLAQSIRPLGPTRARRAAGERDPRAARGVRADALARGLRSYGERRRARSGAHRRRARRGRESRAGRAAGDPRSARDRIGPPVRRAARAGAP